MRTRIFTDHPNIFKILFLFLLICNINASETDTPPNIVIIMADDMGFSDLGCYGSEINTPNIDRLADNGIRFTNFYNAARCCPTRASLLTGLYPHQTGMGGMVSSRPAKSKPGPYQGYLNRQCVTIAEVLKTRGYQTYMSGKWHVAETHPNWPMDRGFDDYFGLISGAAHYFDIRRTKAPGVTRHFARGNQEYSPPIENWYMTDALTDSAVSMLVKHGNRPEPFFLYLAYTAPHWPLQAVSDDIAKYRGRYQKGWDKLRAERYQRQIEMNLFDQTFTLSPRDSIVPAWESLDELKKDEMDLKMAVYAAQIACLDRGIGRVLSQLQQMDRFNETIIVFLSDNGACAEGGVFGQDFWGNSAPPGGPEGYHNYGMGWANASNTPFRKYKQYIHEGGITTPLIVSWPAVIKDKGNIRHQPGHIIDIMATVCEISGAEYPKSNHGENILTPEGRSLLPVFTGQLREQAEAYCWEHIGNKGIRQGKWKLVAQKNQPWELYDLLADRTELNNLVTKFPEKAESLARQWLIWAEKCGVKITGL